MENNIENISKLTVAQIRQALKNGLFLPEIITYEGPITYVSIPETNIEIVTSDNKHKENVFYRFLWNTLSPEIITLLSVKRNPDFVVRDLNETEHLLFLKNVTLNTVEIVFRQAFSSRTTESNTRVITFASDINDNYICLEFLENKDKEIQRFLNLTFCEDKNTLLAYVFSVLKIDHKLKNTVAELFKNDLDIKIEKKSESNQKNKVKI